MTKKEAIFKLRQVGITKVDIHYAGSGDSGDIESFIYFIGNEEIELHVLQNDPIKIAQQAGEIASLNVANKKHNKKVSSVIEVDKNAIEDALGDLTNSIDGDWYNNEGGQGHIIINTKTSRVTIEAEYNIMNQEYETQEFNL